MYKGLLYHDGTATAEAEVDEAALPCIVPTLPREDLMQDIIHHLFLKKRIARRGEWRCSYMCM